MNTLMGILLVIGMMMFSFLVTYQEYTDSTEWKIKVIAYGFDDTFLSFLLYGTGYLMVLMVFLVLAFCASFTMYLITSNRD